MENQSLKCIIVDDDSVSKNLIKSYIDLTRDLELLGQFSNPTAALNSKLLQFSQILFLDIEMPEMNGFELLKNLNYQGKVIVISSNPNHALNGFEWDVVDFLLKPIPYDRFRRAVEKVHKLNGNNHEEEILTITSGKTSHRIREGELLYIEGAGEYLNVVTKSGHFLVYSNMKNMMTMLNGNFIQIHRSFIVNCRNIEIVTKNKVTIAGKCIPVSRTYDGVFKQKFFAFN